MAGVPIRKSSACNGNTQSAHIARKIDLARNLPILFMVVRTGKLSPCRRRVKENMPLKNVAQGCSELLPLRIGAATELDRLAVRRVTIGIGQSCFAFEQRDR